jgi:hypothetical protein
MEDDAEKRVSVSVAQVIRYIVIAAYRRARGTQACWFVSLLDCPCAACGDRRLQRACWAIGVSTRTQLYVCEWESDAGPVLTAGYQKELTLRRGETWGQILASWGCLEDRRSSRGGLTQTGNGGGDGEKNDFSGKG